jgi:hypothetical protein
MRERGHLEKLSVDGRILLKRIFNKWVGVGMNCIVLARDTDRWRTVLNGVAQYSGSLLTGWGPVG